MSSKTRYTFLFYLLIEICWAASEEMPGCQFHWDERSSHPLHCGEEEEGQGWSHGGIAHLQWCRHRPEESRWYDSPTHGSSGGWIVWTWVVSLLHSQVLKLRCTWHILKCVQYMAESLLKDIPENSFLSLEWPSWNFGVVYPQECNV